MRQELQKKGKSYELNGYRDFNGSLKQRDFLQVRVLEGAFQAWVKAKSHSKHTGKYRGQGNGYMRLKRKKTKQLD